MTKKLITVVGGGLAGAEAANIITYFGIKVRIYEMRPHKQTPAHKTSNLAELVCSNSLKSNSLDNASGILKGEMRKIGSIVLEAAEASKVPAGKALAVDRNIFSEYITKKLEANPLVEIIREEYTNIEAGPQNPLIIASGPLTSSSLCEEISKITGSKHLHFYDSISPIIDSDTIDHSTVFRASRYSFETEGDYLNCPLDEKLYYQFVEELKKGDKVKLHEFEKPIYFESCMPIEVLAERGPDTLRFGPMKPVGLVNPKTKKIPFAVVQLRAENREQTMYNMVGFQTKLTYPEQRRIFRMIPGLEKAEILRYGSIHRNTYINSPELLNEYLQLKSNPYLYFAGQITGVEGYIESAATGLLCGIHAARQLLGKKMILPHPATSLGALIRYIVNPGNKQFQPMNINFGLYPPLEKGYKKSEKKKLIAQRALRHISAFNPHH